MQSSQGHQESEMMNNQLQPPPPQDRRLKPLAVAGGDSSQAAAAAALQQHPPQKCPRCESMNTKFCYYNNYSLTQPRYFCKGCRRYWTQGGTLRNVPVGGGCRKGKRAKVTSSSHSGSTTASSSLSQQQNVIMTSNPAGPVSSTGMGQFYPGGDFLSCLTAGQPSNQLPGFSSGDQLACGSSSMSLLQGYAALQFSQAFHQTQAQLYQFGNQEKGTSSEMENTLYTSDQDRLIQSGASQSQQQQQQQNWQNQSLLGHSSTVSDGTNLWTLGSNTGKGTSTTNTTGAAALNPNQWPDLSGFGAP